jgi:hypothetical protein
MDRFHPAFTLAWLGLPMILAHPLRPCGLTGFLTVLGLLLWFFAGFLAVMVAVWGA